MAKAISEKQYRVELPAEQIAAKAAPVRGKELAVTDAVEGSVLQIPAYMPLGIDRRFLYPLLARTPVTTELSVSDFRQVGDRAVTGSVERDLIGTTEKAELDLEVQYVSDPLRQAAVVIKNIPNALLDAAAALRVFLQSEGQYQVDAAVDAHVMTAIDGADTMTGSTGTTLVQKIRNAIGAHRAAGYNPTIAVVDPTDAAALDLYATGTDGAHAFPLGAYGASSPLFGLTVVEHAGTTDPTLIDPVGLGTLALGGATVDVDRGGENFTKNTSTLRVECSLLMVVRNGQAVYVIA